MTNREFLNSVIEIATSDEMKAHALALIEQMDKRNAKRSSTPSKTAVANEPIKAQILDTLGATPKTAAEIALGVEVTTQKASALLRQLVESGAVVATEVKVKGKGKVKGYTLVGADAPQYLDREVTA